MNPNSFFDFCAGIIVGMLIVAAYRSLRNLYDRNIGHLKKALLLREQTAYDQSKLIDQLKATVEAANANQKALADRVIKLKSENQELREELDDYDQKA